MKLRAWLLTAALVPSILAAATRPGAVDRTFDPGGGPDAPVDAMVLQPDGKIVVGGTFLTFNGQSRRGLIRLDSNGSMDADFTPELTLTIGVSALTIDASGELLVGSHDSSVRVVRLNTNGTMAQFFQFSTTSPSLILARPDGSILVGRP